MKRRKESGMGRMLFLITLAALILTIPTALWAAEEPKTTPPPTKEKAPPERTRPATRLKILGSSLLIGRALYSYDELGTNGKSCKSCHKQGQDSQGQPWKRKTEETYMNGKMSLVKAINFCITSHQGGTALAAGGSEMKSLSIYVSSLQK